MGKDMAEPTYFGSHLAHVTAPVAPAPVAIIGGGPVGMTLALALHAQGIPCRIFDARSRGAARQDARTLALSHGAQLSLQELGVWSQIAPQATPILDIHVSQRGGFGRTHLSAREQGVAALGQVVPLAALATALDEALLAAGIDYVEAQRIVAVRHDSTQQAASLQLADGSLQAASLVVHADGGVTQEDSGSTRPDESIRQRDYGQHAVICDISARTPHHHRAWERFTPQGPLALLPLAAAHAYSLVYTCAPAAAQRLLALSDEEFVADVQQHFGNRLEFVAASCRHRFPLALRYRQQPVAARRVWLGNAAQTLHPVAGQGFNLALRDVMALAATLAGASDPGAPGVLAAYARRRRPDRLATIGITDGLVRLFSNDLAPLRLARGLGLLALDLLPPLRAQLARQMMYGLRR